MAIGSDGTATKLAQAPRNGFETQIPVTGPAARFEVQALDAGSRVIGTSRPFTATSTTTA
jgi:hypothetical protein